jgi:N-glycosylase/DNA lyase
MKSLISDRLSFSKSINIYDSLFSGQSFIWNKKQAFDGYYSCCIEDNILFLKQVNHNTVDILSTSTKLRGLPIREFIEHYFTIDIDNNGLFSNSFSKNYPVIRALIDQYLSIKILRQDPFETLITFMCAQGIGMHLIRRQVSLIAENYGEHFMVELDEDRMNFHGFPKPSSLAAADIETLKRCTNNNSIRAANIIAVSKAVDSGVLDLSLLASNSSSCETIRATLCVYNGIGLKIADCIALFGLGRFSAFPIDTHVRQFMGEWFHCKGAGKTLTERNYLLLQDQARQLLDPELAGYAGHILFHSWRKEIRKLNTF